MSKYNGYKNWNHWNVSLWINNDERLYRMALDCIEETRTRDRAASLMLDMIGRDTITPDGAPYSKSSIRAAMVGM